MVQSLLDGGRPVVAVSPVLDRLQPPAGEPGDLTTLPGRVDDDRSAGRLAAELRAIGRPLAGVVAAFPAGSDRTGSASGGRLLDQTTSTLRECLDQTVLAQLALARQLIPLLAESGRNGRYVIVGGPGSETPWAGYGARSVAMAATRMLAQVLYDEARPLGVRVHLLSIDAPVRSDAPSTHECPEWPTVRSIAGRVLQLLDRAPAEAAAGPVVTCGRSAARATAPYAARTVRSVPDFLESLRTATGTNK